MVSYGSNSGYGTSSGHQVVGYGSSGTGYSVTTSSWQKTTCCGARKFNQICTDCPG
ncbi:hypothetical protein HOE37_04835 [Candidatus Woesearchaeota archaeon]|nr:hypothetical protein [Candidatus Woesearchaeota archaeon]MBT4336739.1 hypothetical protein [Candidatus Woesearchaeota archaeon]MBT4469407.1 hypothetical protein [Candidatus Woesearchaeota archaeon]MBT6744198.1 hypothetical protein [Candidatus Woesearchaeota archaeon]